MSDKLSLRYVREYNIATDQNPTRLDVEIVRLSVRPRWKRALRWPMNVHRLMRAGLPLRASARLAWTWIWLHG